MERDRKFKFILIAVLLAIFISASLSFRGLFNIIGDLQWQVSSLNQKLDSLSNVYNNLEQNIKNELALQESILSSYDVSYGNLDSASLKGDITIALTPKEHKESTQASITLGDKSFPMSQKGSSYVALIPMVVDMVYSKFVVSFHEGDTIRIEEVEAESIGFINVINHSFSSVFKGEIVPGKNDEYSIRGKIELYDNDAVGDFSEAKLIALKNNTEPIWEAEDMFTSKDQRMLVADVNDSFTLDNGGSISLYVEMKDSYGFIHRIPIENAQYVFGDGVTGASFILEPEIYDGSGKLIEFKYH